MQPTLACLKSLFETKKPAMACAHSPTSYDLNIADFVKTSNFVRNGFECLTSRAAQITKTDKIGGMSHERLRHLLIRELSRQPLKVLTILWAQFSPTPVYRKVRLCTGREMIVNFSDTSHAYIALAGDCEPEVTTMMRKCLSSGDTFVDGGANVGLKTAIAHHIVTDTGLVLAVEPTLRTFELLKANAAGWSTTAIETHQLALSDRSDSAVLTDYGPRYAGLNTLLLISRSSHRLKGKHITVRSITLDELIGQRMPSALKLDLEGNEYHALLGARTYLTKYHPDVIFETGNKDTVDALRLLASLGYGFFGLVKNRLAKINEDTALKTLNILASRHCSI